MNTFIILSVVIGVTTGHLCMISPPQRGSMMGINKKGATDCVLLPSPCGGRKAGSPVLELYAGKQFNIIIQKNLDHFNSASPGNFTVAIGDNESSLKTITSIPDNSDGSLTLYSIPVTMPEKTGNMVLQTVYNTNNPKAPPMFNQCSDVRLVKSKKEEY